MTPEVMFRVVPPLPHVPYAGLSQPHLAQTVTEIISITREGLMRLYPDGSFMVFV